jgi:hypothetical protein
VTEKFSLAQSSASGLHSRRMQGPWVVAFRPILGIIEACTTTRRRPCGVAPQYDPATERRGFRMKFAQNRLYIESYDKCPNCGLLLYESHTGTVLKAGARYCSQWCVEWEADRNRRRAAEREE